MVVKNGINPGTAFIVRDFLARIGNLKWLGKCILCGI